VRVLITGGAGFIGSNLVEELVTNGYSVTVLDDLSTGFYRNIERFEIDFIQGSILDKETLLLAASNCVAIVHLAALGSVPRSVADPLTSHNVNVNGTVNVLEVARTTNARVIFASSSSVYGSVETIPRHEDLATRPMSPYAASKLAGEGYVLAYGNSYNLSVLPLRFFNVYGPKQAAGHAYAAVVPTFIDAAMKGEPIYIDGDGEQTRDFTYVDTVTGAIRIALDNSLTSPIPINLALGTTTSINQVAAIVVAEFNREVEIKHRVSRTGDVRSSPSDPTRLIEKFEELPSIHVEIGIKKTVEWYSRTR